MSFVAEDGTGLEGANSLVSVEFADSYFALRGVESWELMSLEEKQSALIVATDYIHVRFNLRGRSKTKEQSLHYPLMGQESVPNEVKKACCEYAIVKDQLFFVPKFDKTGKEILSKIVNASGVSTSFTYAQGASASVRRFPHADMLMRGFITSNTMVIK